MTVARTLETVLGPDLPIAVRAYDGSRLGPADAPATLLVRSPNDRSEHARDAPHATANVPGCSALALRWKDLRREVRRHSYDEPVAVADQAPLITVPRMSRLRVPARSAEEHGDIVVAGGFGRCHATSWPLVRLLSVLEALGRSEEARALALAEQARPDV